MRTRKEPGPLLSAVLYPSPDGAGAGASEARVTGGRGGDGRSLSSPQMGPPVQGSEWDLGGNGMEDTWKPPVFSELQRLGCIPPQGPVQGGC